MIKVNLPRRFEEKLRDIQELEGIVISTIAEYGDILTDNKLYFFEEYTDHGVKHIESILESTSNLVTENTLKRVLSGKDIACFILSTVLHDIAMHITLDGFNQLLNGQFDDTRTKELDKYTWRQLWDDYLNEAKKFSGKQLTSVFGDQHLIIREPPLQSRGEINANDRKLIGEFIRRHHARLAHEIALKGFPGKDKPLKFAEGLDHRHKQLIGLIARSHGQDLRTSMDYIESEYGIKTRRYVNGVHIVFLMVLLRLADYLQIDRSRTSGTLLKLKTFASPFSANEHHAHLSIDFIDGEFQNDPERIFVHASPKDSSMYLKIRRLLKDIQHEFDISWAVLGELYGNLENKPEIKYRRITSNLHEESFFEKQAYVPDKFHFKSNDDMVKLLIAPLYGNHPKYGVRELLQNAVDACREREIREKKANADYKAAVVINIFKDPEGDTYFEIRDNGVGMTIEVIKDYFLTAGASYRKSFDWQKAFTDPEGNSVVNRNGQFGVGVLAAFLIGQCIYVETRNINSDTGYKFFADLNSEQINVLKDHTIKTGTLIKIKIDNPNFDLPNLNLDWTKWYVLSHPPIKYHCMGKEIAIPFQLGPNPQALEKEWHSLDSKGYNKIFWTYDTAYEDERKFVCNGIVIPNAFNTRHYLDLSPFEEPSVSVLDNNGLLPLTLDREKLSAPVSFTNDLREEICKDFLAHILLFEPSCQVMGPDVIIGSQDFMYPGLPLSKLRHYLVSKKGFLPITSFTASKANISNLIEITTSGIFRHLELDIQDAFLLYETTHQPHPFVDFSMDFLHLSGNRTKAYGRKKRYLGTNVFIANYKYDQLFYSGNKRIPPWVKIECKIEHQKHNIFCMTHRLPGSSIITDAFLEKYHHDIIIIKELKTVVPDPGNFEDLTQLKIDEPNIPVDVVDKLMERYLGDNVVIPYSIEERKALYPLAFEELEYYMQKY